MSVIVTDAAGEMVEVGQGVKKFKVGDKVVALLSYSVSSRFIPFLKCRFHMCKALVTQLVKNIYSCT